ncbi:hypothetical protein BG011_000082 [Mortierella polycephala]|uniref:CsbD-like domain-containing protein n=1 Tax=Mortierella polycephala TaxID=41804 RepID=A0A9P6Q9G1_9FUNG|nr:hypothetical protein BG011_000082 [Mortierella polycephala]
MTSKINNTYNEAVGVIKEKVGNATGNQYLAGTGAAQKNQAQVNQHAHDAHTHAKGVGHSAEGTTQRAVGGAMNDNSMEARGHGDSALGNVQRSV